MRIILFGTYNITLVFFHAKVILFGPVKPLNFLIVQVQNPVFVNEPLEVGSDNVEE